MRQAAVSGSRANVGGAVIQRAEQHQFVMGISERTDVTPQSGFATIAKLTINGEDICHTKSGKLVNDCTSAHAEDVAVEVLKDKCWDAAAGRASPIVAGQVNEVWLYISSSPCTSDSRGGRPATSTKDIGCTEMLMHIQQNGMPSSGSLWAYGQVNGQDGPTYQIRFNLNYDKLYQPQAGPGMGPLGGGKDASRRAVGALEGTGVQIF